VVFHDDTLDRLTHATGPVAKRTARELSDLVLVGSDERIPTLRDVLELVDGQVPI
jgi:glycerophosphoryl diester phosphodiesterase